MGKPTVSIPQLGSVSISVLHTSSWEWFSLSSFVGVYSTVSIGWDETFSIRRSLEMLPFYSSANCQNRTWTRTICPGPSPYALWKPITCQPLCVSSQFLFSSLYSIWQDAEHYRIPLLFFSIWILSIFGATQYWSHSLYVFRWQLFAKLISASCLVLVLHRWQGYVLLSSNVENMAVISKRKRVENKGFAAWGICYNCSTEFFIFSVIFWQSLHSFPTPNRGGT